MPSLRNRTVLALAEVISACFDFHVNVGGNFQSRTRPDLLADFLYEYEFPTPLVTRAKQLPVQPGAIKDFVLGLDIRAGQAPPLACLLQSWEDAPHVSQNVLRNLAEAILQHCSSDRVLVKPGRTRVDRLLVELAQDGYVWRDQSLAVDRDTEGPQGQDGADDHHHATSPSLRQGIARKVLNLLYDEYLKYGKLVSQYTPTEDDEEEFAASLAAIQGTIEWLASQGLVTVLGIDGTCMLTHRGVMHWEDRCSPATISNKTEEGKSVTEADEKAVPEDGGDPSKVFIIHGQNTTAATEMARFLRALGLEPIEWGNLRASLGGHTSTR